MKVLRSWPEVVPSNRAYVVDQLPRLIMKDYDYRLLGDVDDDVLLLEWDIAVDPEGLGRFIERIRSAPERVLVAPYRLYTSSEHSHPLREPIWAHRVYDGPHRMRWVTEGDPVCHLWGLGMTYLPKAVISAFLSAWPGHFSDGALSGWHHRNVCEDVPIAWDVRPIHLHYPTDGLGL